MMVLPAGVSIDLIFDGWYPIDINQEQKIRRRKFAHESEALPGNRRPAVC